jgi:hypothetical protein
MSGEDFPVIVTLCGSTRFWREFQRAGLAETMEGRIVLSIGAASGTDDEHFGNLPQAEYDRIKGMLDTLHLRKIDLCDEILVLNKDGYVGDSTAREIVYAVKHGKRVRWLEDALDPICAVRMVLTALKQNLILKDEGILDGTTVLQPGMESFA